MHPAKIDPTDNPINRVSASDPQPRRRGPTRLLYGSKPHGGRTDAQWGVYTARKQEWIRTHPNASSREIDRAARAIAKALGL